jgi:prophage maintenance system killer protein
MHYLTVQDVLWIHLQIAKKAEKFHYAKLEEAVGYQYAYGKSKDVISQAARFFWGFQQMSPFEGDNRAVAMAAGITFLKLNGLNLNVGVRELPEWFARVSNRVESKLAVETSVVHDDHGHHTTPREAATSVLAAYESAIQKVLVSA